MAMNIFGAGRDELLDTLARRDAERRMEEDRARRTQLDAETRLDRDRQFGLQDRQLDSIDQDRDERRQLAQASADAAREQNAEKQAAIDAYMQATTPEEKQQAQMNLELRHGVKIAAPPAPRLRTLSPGQQVINEETGEVVSSVPDRPRQAPQGPQVTPYQIMNAGRMAVRDAQAEEVDQRLPQGMSVAQRAQELRDEYLSALGVDPSKAAPLSIREPTPAGAGPGTDRSLELPPDPSRPASGQDIPLPAGVPAPGGRGAGPGPLGAGGGPGAAPPINPAPQVDPLDAAAEKFLRDNGAPITPANIAAVKARMAGGGQ